MEEALEMIREAMAGWIASVLEDGDPVPEPVAEGGAFPLTATQIFAPFPVPPG